MLPILDRMQSVPLSSEPETAKVLELTNGWHKRRHEVVAEWQRAVMCKLIGLRLWLVRVGCLTILST